MKHIVFQQGLAEEDVLRVFLLDEKQEFIILTSMMNSFKKSILVGIMAGISLLPLVSYAGVSGIPWGGELAWVSMAPFQGATTEQKASSAALGVLSTAKVILNGIAVIYIVVIGVMMIIAYGDEGQLSKQKKQLLYGLVAFLFVNIPGQIYNIMTGWRNISAKDVTATPNGADYAVGRNTWANIFINFDLWNSTVENGVVAFLRVIVIGFAILYFTLAGIKLIVSWGNEDARKSAKNQAIYGFLSLIFLWVIQAWVSIAYSGNLPKGQTVFAQLANLALFFAGPTAIFFLTLGAWYLITSGGDEERVKKGKSIVLNTFIAVIILLASYTFLKDLSDFRL